MDIRGHSDGVSFSSGSSIKLLQLLGYTKQKETTIKGKATKENMNTSYQIGYVHRIVSFCVYKCKTNEKELHTLKTIFGTNWQSSRMIPSIPLEKMWNWVAYFHITERQSELAFAQLITYG